jgi:hypothetical protein
MPVAGEQPDAGAVAPRHQPEVVMLDLVQPRVAAGRLFGLRWEAGRNEAGTQHGTANRACRPARQDDPRPEGALKAGGARLFRGAARAALWGM